MFQTTVAKKIVFEGVGLHSGKKTILEIEPTEADYGIRFLRTDLQNAEPVLAQPKFVVPSDLCTTIGLLEENRISTIEHLMATFSGIGIDNALVRIDGPEIPILDGSAFPFVSKLVASGTRALKTKRSILKVIHPFEVTDGLKKIRIEPSDETIFSSSITFENQVIGTQKFEVKLSSADFRNLSDARTFCHIRDVDAMRRAGLALGGSLENAVVVTDQSVLNAEGLRHRDEFVRHKIIDCIGDFYLLGRRIVGKVSTERSGHAFHVHFLKQLLANQERVMQIV